MTVARTGRGRAGPRRLAATFAAATAVLAGVLSGCSGSPEPAAQSGGVGVQGTYLQAPIDKPDLTLTDTTGAPFNLRARTAGTATLLYFGYTHCPDVCPTTMADIALALRRNPALTGKVDVVFVTTDPRRDTAPVIKAWLSHFDARFTGLTGPIKTIYAAADHVGVPLAEPDPKATGDYPVSHGAQVLAFSPDGKARVVYTAGTSADAYAHDLTLLTENKI